MRMMCNHIAALEFLRDNPGRRVMHIHSARIYALDSDLYWFIYEEVASKHNFPTPEEWEFTRKFPHIDFIVLDENKPRPISLFGDQE